MIWNKHGPWHPVELVSTAGLMLPVALVQYHTMRTNEVGHGEAHDDWVGSGVFKDHNICHSSNEAKDK